MMTVVVDADVLIALVNKDDALATKTIKTLESLYNKGAKLVYPSTSIVEAITAIQRKLNNPDLTNELAQMIRDSQFDVVSVDQTILELAETLFKPYGSKQNTLFDAVVGATAKSIKADAVFSFDGWYEKVGLKLATSLI
jgi:predicted nucleic acid-binding protein